MMISATSPTPVNVTTSRRMSRQRTRDTEPEMLLRRELHRRGLRYRVDAALPGLPRRRADVLFTRARVAVFVDGCFWHGCPEHKTAPTSNGAWWAAKLARNIERDCETDAHLRSFGWTVLRVWEHDDIEHVATDIEQIVRCGQLYAADSDAHASSPD
jgi:DNA mismatch endonuclease (patch repair protein)